MHVHPLAIIPLRKDNSSNSSRNSSRNRSRSPDHTSKTQVPVRALIPRPSVHQQGGGVAGGSGATEAARSDDDNALMKGLISLLPHEQADSQVGTVDVVLKYCHLLDTAGLVCSRRQAMRHKPDASTCCHDYRSFESDGG